MKRYKPPALVEYTNCEMQDLLTSKIIYNDHDILALWKPYGIKMFNNVEKSLNAADKSSYERQLYGKSLEDYLPYIAAQWTVNSFMRCTDWM